jgi:hypothetical protein
VGASLLFAVTFHAICNGPGEPDAPYDRPDVAALAADISDYRRTEESTYLTLLEWYQVFSYQEYAAHLATEEPSAFPYFTAIGQSWSMYCLGYGETEGTYPFNFGNHLMLVVIGTSFTAEYGLKGLYEYTVGWLTEFDAYDTQEDRYAAEVARDYGEFIERDPWYAYPFGAKTVGVWTENDFFGSDFLRKTERKVFLTLEYGVKAGYAGIIRLATGAIYGAPPATDYLWVENASQETLAVEGVRIEREMGEGQYVIAVPHYQGFTDAIPVLARNGVRFVDVSGNDEIVLTVLAPHGWDDTPPSVETLAALDVPTDPATQRVVMRAPVRDLHAVLLGLEERGARIEHLFDY